MGMKLGISNLAWEKDDNIIWILKENNIYYVEIILPKHINWIDLNTAKLYDYVNYLKNNDLKILSTQAIFFNSDVKEFIGDDFINHIIKVSELCKNIGVEYIVLGAPTMRTTNSYNKLGDTFKHLNEIVKNNNQFLLLEPNSRVYNGKFFHTLDEIISFIDKNEFTNIKTMVDTHNMILENEIPSEAFLQNKKYIKHIHISEVELGEFKESKEHNKLADILKKENYNGLIVYEAKPSLNLEQNIKLFSKIYNK